MNNGKQRKQNDSERFSDASSDLAGSSAAFSENRTAESDHTDRTRIRKRDWIAALIILAAAGCLLLVFQLTRKQSGNYAQIRIDGELYGVYSLEQDENFTVETDYGKNVVEIRDGTVCVTDADCDGHDCMRQGKISRCNETIVCLPHKMVIEITLDRAEQEDQPDFDTVAK